MKLFNWINPLWIMDNFLTTRFDPVTLPAVAAPSILGGGMTGAGMMTSSQLPGLMASATPGLMGGLGSSLGGAAMGAIKDNPFGAASLGMGMYDRMNQTQAPLQQSPMQQLMKQQQGVPPAEFNSMLQLPRRPIYIG